MNLHKLQTNLYSSTIIEHLKAHCAAQAESNILLFFYFDFNNLAKQKQEDLVRRLLSQLCTAVSEKKEAFEMFKSLQAEITRQRRTPRVQDLTRLLQAASNVLAHIYVVCDAVDECPVDGE